MASAALRRGLLEAEVRARQSPNSTTLNIPFTLEAARDVIPVGDASSVRGRMESAARALLSEEEEKASTARQLVRAVAAEEAAAIQGAGTLKSEQAALLGLIITQTHLLERCQALDGAPTPCFVHRVYLRRLLDGTIHKIETHVAQGKIQRCGSRPV